MYGCAVQYYALLDSSLNVAYKQLMKKLDLPGKNALKKEELAWLKERDLKFKSINSKNILEGQDAEMIAESEKADFIKERVLVLLFQKN